MRAGTKATGAGLLVGCISAFLGLVFGTLDVVRQTVSRRRLRGRVSRRAMSEYLNRTGSMIVLLTLIFLAIIISTQFSFGRFFAALIAAAQGRRRARHRRLQRVARGAAAREAAPRSHRQAHEEGASVPAGAGRRRQTDAAAVKADPARRSCRDPRAARARPRTTTTRSAPAEGAALRQPQIVRAAEAAEGHHAGARRCRCPIRSR